MSLLSHHTLRSSKPSTSTVQDGAYPRSSSDLRAVGGYLTPPFSPTSTSSRSDYLTSSHHHPAPFSSTTAATSASGSGTGGLGAGGRERKRDKLAERVTKAKEKGKAKLLDSDRYRRSAVVDEEGVEHDPEYRHFRTATPVHRRHRRRSSLSSSSTSSSHSSSATSATDGYNSQYSMPGRTPFTTSLLPPTSSLPSSNAVPAYLPSAHHSVIKPHSNQVVPSLLVPPSNMSRYGYTGPSGGGGARKSAEDFGAARRSSADYSRDGTVDDLGYHLEKVKIPKEKKKKRHLVGLSESTVPPPPNLSTAPRPSTTTEGKRKPKRSASKEVDADKSGGTIDLRTATLRSNAERHAAASGAIPSRSYASKSPLPGAGGAPSSAVSGNPSGTAMGGAGGVLSSTAVAHARRPGLERANSGTSAALGGAGGVSGVAGALGDDGLPSPLANPAPPPPPQISISKVTSRDSSVPPPPEKAGGGSKGPEPNRFVPPPGKIARATRDLQEDYAMGVHGMRRSYESFKLDVRFGMSRTKKKVERAFRQM